MNTQNINESDESVIHALLDNIFRPTETSSFAEITTSSFNYEFDDSIYTLLRRAFDSLERILPTIQSTALGTNEEITDVHKAHNVAPTTIRLLASHTHFLEREQDDLTLVPRMVVDRRSEIEEETYENRFIFSFIQRASLYLEDAIVYFDHFFFDSDSNTIALEGVGQDKASSINIQVRTKSPSFEKMKRLVEPIINLSKDYQGILDAPFCKRLCKAPKVFSPIHRTNIIANSLDLTLLADAWERLDKQTDFGLTVSLLKRNYVLSEQHTAKIKEKVDSFLPVLASAADQNDEDDYEEDEESVESFTPTRSITLEDEVMINNILEIRPIGNFNFTRQLVSVEENMVDLKDQLRNLHVFLQELREDYLVMELNQSKKNKDERLQEKRRAKASKLYEEICKRGRP